MQNVNNKNPQNIEFKPSDDMDLSVVAQQSIDLSKSNNITVHLIFKGIEIYVSNQMTVSDIIQTYHDAEQNKSSEKKQARKPILYTDFSKMDPDDPLIKALKARRPYRSSDFVPKYMIPDLRHTH